MRIAAKSKSTDMRVLETHVSTETIAYRTPMKFGGRVVTAATLLHVAIEVESRSGLRGRGCGSMPLGNAWAWPSGLINGETTLAAMQTFGERMAHALVSASYGHPLELSHAWSQGFAAHAAALAAELSLTEPMPALAQLVAASPADAALHDAYGKMLGENSYNVLGEAFVGHDLGYYLGEAFQGEYLDRYTLRQPKASMPLYHLVGALDALTPGDLSQRLNDGLPETLGEWIAADELTHLKIKLAGDDLVWDVQRVAAIEQVALETQSPRGIQQWYYSCDFNEKCANVEYLLDFFAQIRAVSPAAWERIQYIEQPTSRNLKLHPEHRMHRAAALKPVVIDEALVDLESLHVAREQGYSGIALKACKGQTESLLMGAVAQKYKLFLCVQDLTCPGASFLHSASIAARIPTVAAIEGNGRQYCPAGNRLWCERLPGMFQIQNGTVDTSCLTQAGLGF
jgi:L-alanine-DL-glutamate epimerase-like enolase superfamily enzyme